MSKYKQFIFKDWTYKPEDMTLTLHYSYDNVLNLQETYTFYVDGVSIYSPLALERAISNLFFVAGVSYYKMYPGAEIVVEKGSLDEVHAAFLERTYRSGLGEFFYKNNLDPRSEIRFPRTTDALEPVNTNGVGKLVGLGGGKDSLVSLEILGGDPELASWALNHHTQLTPLIEETGVPHMWATRTWDPQIEELNKIDALNGHVPISAIFATVGTVMTILSGRRDGVVSNERSADEATLIYDGVSINHQYSKSSLFEKDYQALLKADFGDSQRYYSLLRPFSELAIAERFAEKSFEKYKSVFSSCNRAYTRTSEGLFWCGICPKCAFVFLILTPFIGRIELETLFGKNLLLDDALVPMYHRLLGIEGDKPLECVGEIQESRVAMQIAKAQYPELDTYAFGLSEGYNYRAFGPHSIPEDVLKQVGFSQ